MACDCEDDYSFGALRGVVVVGKMLVRIALAAAAAHFIIKYW